MREVHAAISGRVQGVGFRAYVADHAERLKLRGWVRNLADGRVEAIFVGDGAAVAEMLDLLRNGPGSVNDIETAEWTGEIGSTFEVLPTI